MKIEDMISANRADCCGCEACANVCPKNAITMTRDAEGFAYPTIDPERCIRCGRCDATCPSLNFAKKIPDEFPETFAAINPDEKIRRHSSSGGVFTALSEIILREGGVVFGAAFDKNWHVCHTSARSLDELEKLRGSKYVQSKIGDVYRQVSDALETSPVLFSGTPCQCAGLRHFLGGDRENLLTVDLICRGVPSPALWEKYIGEFAKCYDISHVNFRSKREGWVKNFEINFSNRIYFFTRSNQNFYGKFLDMFLSLRPSCSACKFKFPDVQSDLTLGDAWGVKNFAPEMFDDRGTSVVVIHTPKGKNFFERANLRTRQIKFSDVALNNLRYTAPSLADSRRAEFFADFAAAADKFDFMRKYFAQDDANIRKQTVAKNKLVSDQNYRELAAHIRQKFTENILVAAPQSDAGTKNFFADHFAHNSPQSAVYFLELNAKGALVCRENFSSLTFELKPNVDELDNFVKKFNITQIVADDPSKFPAPVAEWLESCGSTVQNLPQPPK